uniref:Uncharacterized protein n=1 Tax=Ditylenchus dipsaci TaxID=166011 RepID=A0A915D657_9BILA
MAMMLKMNFSCGNKPKEINGLMENGECKKRRAKIDKHIMENFDCSYSRRIGCECKASATLRTMDWNLRTAL